PDLNPGAALRWCSPCSLIQSVTEPLQVHGSPRHKAREQNMQNFNRRMFLKATGALTVGAALLDREDTMLRADDVAKGAPHAEKLGWRLGCQAWTFNRFTFYEAIDKTAELGLKFIEAFPHGQKLSKTNSAMFGRKLSADDRKEVKKYLADEGVTLVNMGVGP